MINDTVIIGSGLSALGAVMALEDGSKTLRYKVVSDDRNIPVLYDNNLQLSRFYGFGGTSTRWHGVIPLIRDLEINNFSQLLSRFYDIGDLSDLKNKTSIFIPKHAIKSNYEINNILKSNEDIIYDYVKQIKVGRDNIDMFLNSGSVLKTKSIIMAVGAADIPKIIIDSSLLHEIKYTAGDHICGFAGFMSRMQIIDRLGIDPHSISKTKYGYIVPAFGTNSNRTLLTVRPASFEMKKKLSQLRGGPIYANTKYQIIMKILLQLGLGRIREVFALRYGILWKSKLYSIHFQTEFNDFWNINKDNYEIERPAHKTDANLVSNISEDHYNHTALITPQQELYYGTHLFNTVSQQNIDYLERKKIYVVGPGTEKNIGIGHHSFKSLVLSYNKVKSLF